MKIAQVCPLYESCPPRFYGGTERVVSHLTQELVRQGHEVTLFASADSQTTANLHACCEQALRLDPKCKDPLPYHLVMLDRVARSVDAFDIIHFHTDFLHFPIFADYWNKTVTTLHGRLDLPHVPLLMREFGMMPLVSISDAQRRPVPWANWPEPFGLVMIEAIANGTPVIAFRRGSVPEIIDDSVTGLIVENIDEAVAAVARAITLDRRAIRKHFEDRFSVERMAREYVALYSEMLRESAVPDLELDSRKWAGCGLIARAQQ